jgi:cobalt-zinc-cadmium efflux system membrane fusion protein
LTEAESQSRAKNWWQRPRFALIGLCLIGTAAVASTFYKTQADSSASDKKSTDTSNSATKAETNDRQIELDVETQKKLGINFGMAEQRPLRKLIRAPGTVSFDERNVTHLKPRTQGRVTQLMVQPGDSVITGQVLAKLDANSILESRRVMDTARASLNDASAAQKQAAAALDRANYLISYKATTPADVEKRQADAAKALATVQSAQAQLDASTAQYERLAPVADEPGASGIISPIAGVVTTANITLGEVIDTNQDAFTVADPSRMLVHASLYASDIGLVKRGDDVTILASEQLLAGKIRSVNVALDAATNTAAARIELPNPDLFLRANMFVSVLIQADLARKAITIPAAAVQITEQGPVAFVRTAPTTFERRDIQLGLQQSEWVEVQKGVAEGETVVTNGSFGLKAILLRSLLGSTN